MLAENGRSIWVVSGRMALKVENLRIGFIDTWADVTGFVQKQTELIRALKTAEG